MEFPKVNPPKEFLEFPLMMRYRLFTVGSPLHEAFFTMSDAIGQTLPDIQIIYAVIWANWAVLGMAQSIECELPFKTSVILLYCMDFHTRQLSNS
jgi:hypothetical protein